MTGPNQARSATACRWWPVLARASICPRCHQPGGSSLVLDSTTGRPVDFTLQVVAIDLAGNESAPQTVRVKDDSGHACAVAHGCSPRRRDHVAGADRHRGGGAAMNRLFAVIAAVSWRRCAPTRAPAASRGPTPYVVDPSMQATDQTPPTLPPSRTRSVTRGKGPEQEGCSQSAPAATTSAPSTIAAAATDDVTVPRRIGYRFTFASGAAACRPASNLPTTPSSRRAAGSDAQLGRRRHGRIRSRSISRCRWWRSISPATRARRRQCSDLRQPQRARLRRRGRPHPARWPRLIAALVLLAAAVARRRRR